MVKGFVSVVAAITLVAIASLGSMAQQAASADSTQAASNVQAPSANVKRAVFTTSVVNREPVDEVKTLKTDVDKVSFFTEILGMEGKTVTHRWIFNGETRAEVPFQIGGPRWRVFSTKTLGPEWTGTWTVDVVDGEGNKLSSASFDYQKAP